jgi:hypothetical protein
VKIASETHRIRRGSAQKFSDKVPLDLRISPTLCSAGEVVQER